MNRKILPLLLMLGAGALTLIITLIKSYSLPGMLFSVLIVMLLFYLLGWWMKSMLDYFEKQNAKKVKAEGEVVEKEPDKEEVPEDETEQA